MNETYTINIDAIYGDGWLERNRKELDNYDWEFRAPKEGEKICSAAGVHGFCSGIAYGSFSLPRIILKPKKTTLSQVYGSSSIKTPAGYKWTKEFREPRIGDTFINAVFGRAGICHDHLTSLPGIPKNRVILEKLPPTVYFKAEAKSRRPRKGDWCWSNYLDKWITDGFDFDYDGRICATKHEEPSTHIETITQADLDKLGL